MICCGARTGRRASRLPSHPNRPMSSSADHSSDTDQTGDSVPTLTGVVLLIDDQPFVGEAVRRLLADQRDLAFHYCSDPLQAIDVANDISPTVILQDLVMPGVDGLELLHRF